MSFYNERSVLNQVTIDLYKVFGARNVEQKKRPHHEFEFVVKCQPDKETAQMKNAQKVVANYQEQYKDLRVNVVPVEIS